MVLQGFDSFDVSWSLWTAAVAPSLGLPSDRHCSSSAYKHRRAGFRIRDLGAIPKDVIGLPSYLRLET